MDLPNITVNLSGFDSLYDSSSPSFAQVCELNQFKMLEQLQKLPVGLFIFISLALAGLLFHLYIAPRIKGSMAEWFKDAGLHFSLMSLVWALLFSFELTFHPARYVWEWLIILAVSMGLFFAAYGIYKMWRGKVT